MRGGPFCFSWGCGRVIAMSIRMRHTRSHTKNRRSHHALTAIRAVPGEKEGTLRLPHRLDEATGVYAGKQIVSAKETKAKEPKTKGPRTEVAHAPTHDHEHDHENAETKQSRGIFGRIGQALPKARRGAGGGGS